MTQPFEKNSVFGLFNERVLSLCNHSFSVMYRRVFKQYWHTGMDARMVRNYCYTSWKDGEYEFYIPTRASLSNHMQYYRIIVKVLPKLDGKTARDHVADMLRQRVKPVGIVDSELIVFVAPRCKTRGFWRGFKHVKKKGYLCAIVIRKEPERVMKTILELVANFIRKRLHALLETLKMKPLQYEYSTLGSFYYKARFIIEQFSYHIAMTLRSFSHVLNWVIYQHRRVMKEIGRQNMLRRAIRKVSELKNILQDANIHQPQIIAQLQAVLVKATNSEFSEIHTPKLSNFKPSSRNKVQNNQTSGDPLTFLDRLSKAKPLAEAPDRVKVRWKHGS